MVVHRSRQGRESGGFVLLVVLFVLLALFALAAPFLGTARNANAASHFDKDEAQLRIALDGAARHARHSLEGTHVALDKTPYFDSADELIADMTFPDGFEGVNDVNGVAIGVGAEDLAGRIDLNSAPPQVLANLLGGVARLGTAAMVDDMTFKVSNPTIFADDEVIVVNAELVRLGEQSDETRSARMLKVIDRGVGAVKDKDDNWSTTGPLPPRNHGVGSYVFNQRMMAPAVWRSLAANGEPNAIDAIEEIRASEDFSMSGGFDDPDLRILRRTTTPYGSVGAGADWQRPTRITVPLIGGESYEVRVRQGRWMGMGSTIRIANGIQSELRLVMGRGGDGRVLLDRAVEFDYEPDETEVSILSRRPVNVNSASAEVLTALFSNLKLRGQNHRIQESEAAALASVIVVSRPFDSFEDFVKRIVLPAAGIDVLPEDAATSPAAFSEAEALLDDPRDGVALYYNALNANDARLEFSTMPLSFTSRSVFELELRANISAASGVERASGVRERVELIVPQRRELLHVFSRQEDFDAALRLSRAAPYWLTGPEATGRYDAGVYPPSRAVPHLGTLRGASYIPGVDEPVLDADENVVQAQRVFASRDDLGYLQLDPIRLMPTERTSGRILHFDQESRSVEGRFLPDEPVIRDATRGEVGWVSDSGANMVQPLSLSLWVKPEVAGGGTLMSVGNRGPDSDRIILGLSEGNLVLRVLDGMGDHRATTFQEVSEVRMPIGGGASAPGLPTSIWSHVDIDVRGNRPDQISMLVNGSAAGVETPGMTRLSGPLQSGTGTVVVESTDGFPATCTLRIGNEIVEATVAGPTSFAVLHQTAGEFAGYGGRLARVAFDVEGSDTAMPGAAAASGITGSYPAGTTVTHYGYSLPLSDNLPAGASDLPGDLGVFRVGRAVGLPNDTTLEPVLLNFRGDIVNFGIGWTSQTVGPLKLSLADAVETDPAGDLVLAGFNPNGGYAALSQTAFLVDGGDTDSPSGGPVGGVEIVRYSSASGGVLNVVERGVQMQRFSDATGDGQTAGGDLIGGARQFVFLFDAGWTVDSVDPNTLLTVSTFCYPVSVPVPGAGELSFAQPTANRSQFAQITRLDDPEMTEWIRYDEVDLRANQLVRSSPFALTNAYNVLNGGQAFDFTRPLNPGGGGPGTGGAGGGAGGGSGALGGGGGSSSSLISSLASTSASPGSTPSTGTATSPARRAGSDWDPIRGEDPNVDYPLSRAVATALHHRGVLGTSINVHPAGSQILPVAPIRVAEFDFEQGRPGAKDPVFVVNGDPADLGVPLTIHRAHYPAPDRVMHQWSLPDNGVLAGAAAGSVVNPNLGFPTAGYAYFAFESQLVVPAVPGASDVGGVENVTDPRFRSRLVKFPSGELPRSGAEVAIGVGAGGQLDFGPLAATVDEVVFGRPRAFGGLGGTSPVSHAVGSPLMLAAPVSEVDLSISVVPNQVRAADGSIISPTGVLDALPPDAGLLRIGQEILAYRLLSSGDGRIDIAFNGRGLLGSRPQAHAATSPVYWLEGWDVSTLAGGIGPDDSIIPITALDGFPPTGTVLIGAELIHYTQTFGGALTMPRASMEPGAMDNQGRGVFRGRFGTTPSSHVEGSSVIHFPARYWDRYAPRFEGPELGFFGLDVDQPGAFWDGVIWDAQESQTGGPEIVVLQRTSPDVPWDADPEEEPHLTLLEDGDLEGGLIPIGEQADRIEWRVFARYAAGSFDPEFGLSHGWKDTPRFMQLGVTYTAPPRVYRSIDR